MEVRKIILSIIILLLILGNVYLALQYFSVKKELSFVQGSLKVQETNDKILEFTKFFIEKVLKAETEIDFETRLNLENMVRNLEDERILAQWQKFVESKTENEAQAEVKNLLSLLVSRISAK